MTISTVVIDREKAVEFTQFHSIVHHIFLRIIRPIHYPGMCCNSFFVLATGYDVHDSAHSIGAI